MSDPNDRTDYEPGGRPLTGRTVLIIALSAFGVVIAANLTLAFSAASSWPGLIVKNSYVASQGWNARTEAHEALGWEAALAYGEGRVRAEITDAEGRKVEGAFELRIGRPAHDREDRVLPLAPAGGALEAPVALAPGTWLAEIASTEGPDFRVRAKLYVPEGS